LLLFIFGQPNSWERSVLWIFKAANWAGLREVLDAESWDIMDTMSANDAAEHFTRKLFDLMTRFIPQKLINIGGGSHPWLDEHCLDLIREKKRAWGTPLQAEVSETCSRGLFEHFSRYAQTVKKELKTMKRSSKEWWKFSKKLMHKASTNSSISALKYPDGSWARTAKDKAELLAKTFASKWILPDLVENEYSHIEDFPDEPDTFIPIRTRNIERFLAKLEESSGTGPDFIPARILKWLASLLALPFAKLARLIVSQGIWPNIWKIHWICGIFKKKSIYDPLNYRGVQLTAQMSKAMERFLASTFMPDIINLGAFGENQFAYRKEHGARDAVLYLIMSWLLLMANGKRVGVYCSDVSGAFDKVSRHRLVKRLRQWKPYPRF